MKIEDYVNLHGFLFGEIIPNPELYKMVMESSEPTPEIIEGFLGLVKSFDSECESIKCAYEDVVYGESIPLHTHLIPARYQMLVWFLPEKYEGRDFVYGTKDKIDFFHPKYGDVCFMKTNDIKYLHAVTPLKTAGIKARTLVISVDCKAQGGEQITVSMDGSSLLP